MNAFLDTNVLLHAASIDRTDARNRIAIDLLRSDRAFVLSVQVLSEFVVQATKASRVSPIPTAEALRFTQTLRRFRIIALDLDVFDAAARVQSMTGYSWWDSLIVAAAISAGCETLLTEDMQHGRLIDGLRIENPFRELA